MSDGNTTIEVKTPHAHEEVSANRRRQEPDDPSRILADLYADDRREHGAVPPVDTPEYREIRTRDAVRRTRAEVALSDLRACGTPSGDDLFHVAWLYNHGDRPDEAWRAHALAREAAELGHGRARWLTAAAYDRWCMYKGQPQKYGTQFVPDGQRHRLWDVDPTTTDAERAAWDVPPLGEQLRRAEELTRTEPQPPMEGAPTWLKAAMQRWQAE